MNTTAWKLAKTADGDYDVVPIDVFSPPSSKESVSVYTHKQGEQCNHLSNMVAAVDDYSRLYHGVIEVTKFVDGCTQASQLSDGLPTLQSTLRNKGLFIPKPLYQHIVGMLGNVEMKWSLLQNACNLTVSTVARDMNALANGARLNDSRIMTLLFALQTAQPGQIRKTYENARSAAHQTEAESDDAAFVAKKDFIKAAVQHDITVSVALAGAKVEVKRLEQDCTVLRERVDNLTTIAFHVLSAVTLLAGGERKLMIEEWQKAVPLLRPFMAAHFGDEVAKKNIVHPLDVLTHFFDKAVFVPFKHDKGARFSFKKIEIGTPK
jgi:hypothetical protein